MRILVTGAAGFIGSHLCELLLRKGHDVVGLDNMNQFYNPEIKQQNLVAIERTASSLSKEFAFYVADIRHQNDVREILEEHKIELVVHLAAMAGVRPSLQNPLLYNDVNVGGTLTLLEECRKLGIRKFIFGSSSSVYGNNKKIPFSESDSVDAPISPYAASKRSAELSCHVYHSVYDFSIACLRFFTVYGPRQRPDLAIHKFTKQILADQKIQVFGDGSKRRDFTYIDDIISGIDKTLTWMSADDKPRFDIFNLGESRTVSVNEMIALIEKATGKTTLREELPEAAGDVEQTYADLTKSKSILSYDPKTSIEDGIEKFVEWVKAAWPK